MAWIATAIIGSAVLGGISSANQASAATDAAQIQANAATAGQQLQQQNFQNLSPNFTPYMQTGAAGLAGLNAAMPSLTQMPESYKPFTAADLQSNLAPNYQFMLNQGLGAQSQALNVGGGGSNINTANTKFAEDYASNAYQNALANYQNQQAQQFSQGQTAQSNIFNRLSSVAGIGQNAIAGLSNLASGTASNITNLGVGGAQATAAGVVGAANAQASGLSNIGGAGVTSALLNNYGNAQSGQAAINQGQILSGTYGAGNVYGPGGGGQVPTSVNWNID